MIDETVRIAKSSNISHAHDEEETTFGMNANTKKAIEHIFIMGTKTALSIKYALKDPLVLSESPITIKKEVFNLIGQKIERVTRLFYTLNQLKILTRFENLINYDLIYKRFDKLNFGSFEEFMECVKHVHVVTLNRNKWAESSCTCKYYLKKYHCYHIFVIAVNEKLLSIPSQYKDCKIGQKPILGRKPKAKKGDALRKN